MDNLTLRPEIYSRTLRSSGFTMVELLVVVTIVAVLAAVGAPGFKEMIQNFRIRNAATELQFSIQYARTEAIRRGRNVVIQRNLGCPAANWGCGWIVFSDIDNDRTLDPNEPTLRVTAAVRDISIVLASLGGPISISIDPFGEARSPGAYLIRPFPATESSTECTTLTFGSGLQFTRTKAVC